MDNLDLTAYDKARLDGALLKTGFLISGYRPDRYWYEMIITTKKVAIITFTTFAGELSGELQI